MNDLMICILNQAFEESRYYRKFHHILYTLHMTLFLTLLGVQIANPTIMTTIRNDSLKTLIFVGVLLLLLPAYVIYVIFRYHVVHAKLSSLIAVLAESEPAQQVFQKASQGLQDRGQLHLKTAWNALFKDNYKNIIMHATSPIFIGAGHWFFIASIASVVALNIYLFFAWK